MQCIAQVAVERATIYFDRLYSYLIPVHLQECVQPGSVVLVPFGRGSRPRVAVVLEVAPIEQAGEYAATLKSLFDAAPDHARLSQDLIDLVKLLHEHVFCTYYEAVRAIVPYGAQYRVRASEGGYMLERQVQADMQMVYELVSRELCSQLTVRQQQAVQALRTGARTVAELRQMGVTRAVLLGLERKGLVAKGQRKRVLPVYSRYVQHNKAPVLSAHQQRAYDELSTLLMCENAAAALLHGVTSSGKTAVFLKLIEQTLQMNQQALVLVPEISLTAQMIYRLKEMFGERVAVQHSALSHTERLVQWKQIQAGDADIVVGTRSAVFAPLQRIGLIIIDEEHDSSYHSEQAPRYWAHDIAKRRAAAHSALLLLASATPDVTSYYYAQQGRYRLVRLTQRYNEMPLPKVSIVDMRNELLEGNCGSISNVLEQELKQNLAQGEQSVLLLNRRGYQTAAVCTACASVLHCTACSVPMVYHKSEQQLMCHYCGRAIMPAPDSCPQCGERMKYSGFGTQRIEEELAQRLPTARILRMDFDTTRKKNAHEMLLAAFARGEYDIMLGTQMVAKGLDFERVTLVGVLGIDQMLFGQGYRAQEAAFALIAQVIGRAGRANRPGRALVQTMNPTHQVLQLAAAQDYESFYHNEIAYRRLNLYPPFCRVCVLGFSAECERRAAQAAQSMAKVIRELAAQQPQLPLHLLGPAPMGVAMVNGRYRYRLLLKCRPDTAFRVLLRQALARYDSEGMATSASLHVDFYADSEN